MCGFKCLQWFFIVGVCFSTIDINIHQLQFVADHLEKTECRKLSEALRQPKFAVPVKIPTGEKEPDLPCIYLLLKWDRTDGAGKSAIDLSLRLHQIGRGDLGKKLAKFVFDESANELNEEFLDDPFKKKIVKDSFLLAADSDADDIRKELQPDKVDTGNWSADKKLEKPTVKTKTGPEIVIVIKSSNGRENSHTESPKNFTKESTNDVYEYEQPRTETLNAQTSRPMMNFAKKDIGSSSRRASSKMKASKQVIKPVNRPRVLPLKQLDMKTAPTLIQPVAMASAKEQGMSRKLVNPKMMISKKDTIKSPKLDSDTENIVDADEDEDNSGLESWEIVSIICGVVSVVAVFSFMTYYLCGTPIARMFWRLAPNGVIAWCDMISRECSWFCKKTQRSYNTVVVGSRSKDQIKKTMSLYEMNKNLNNYLHGYLDYKFEYFDD